MTVAPPKSIEWVGGIDGHIAIIDQTRLPGELVTITCHNANAVYEAIASLRIRGAPAIGVAAAMGVVLGVRNFPDPWRTPGQGDDAGIPDAHAVPGPGATRKDQAALRGVSRHDVSPAATPDAQAPATARRSHRRTTGMRRGVLARIDDVCDYLVGARPTAVNLSWALERMRRHARAQPGDTTDDIVQTLLAEAQRIRQEDADMCRAIGRAGAHLIRDGIGVLTHCNAGALATAGIGTALAPLYTAHDAGVRFRVFADETRPLLQGARLTAWELNRAGVDVTLLCDSMAAALMRDRKVDIVITGADRIAANGDTANKIGTYALAVLARAHDVPLYVAAPSTTFDLAIPDGRAIPIEYRSPDELRAGFGPRTAPPDVPCYCPAFDVTPAELIRGIVTERGMIQPVDRDRIRTVLG